MLRHKVLRHIHRHRGACGAGGVARPPAKLRLLPEADLLVRRRTDRQTRSGARRRWQVLSHALSSLLPSVPLNALGVLSEPAPTTSGPRAS